MIYTVSRQKEFGVIGDIYHSGLKRASQKYLGRSRKKLARYLADSSLKDKEKLQKVSSTLDSSTPVNIGPKKRKSLYLEAHSKGAGVIGLPGEIESRYTQDQKRLPEISKRAAIGRILSGKMKESETKKFLKRGIKAKKRIQESKYKGGLIFHHGSGDEILAHELGHLGNRYSKNPITRGINAANQKINPGRDYTLGNGIVTWIKSGLSRLEENNASKRGYKLLKKAGASKRELELAKNNLDLAGETYRLDGNRKTKRHLALSIAIPSQRSKLLGELGRG